MKRAVWVAVLIMATAVMAVLSAYRLWRHAWDPIEPGRDFALDLIAYIRAAERLVATGSPYHPTLLAGPIENVGSNVPIGYFYPPPLAELFVVLAPIPYTLLATVWTVAQVAILAWLVPTLYRRAGGRLRPVAGVALLFVCLASWPLNFALFIGNVSGWISIAVGGLLVAGPRPSAFASAALTFIKLTPLPFLAAAVVGGKTRLAAIVSSILILAVSFAIAPGAWFDWIRVLPNIGRMEAAAAYGNLGPAAILGRYGFEQLGVILGWALAAGFGLAAVRLSRREGMTPRTIAAATFATLFVAATVWDHYLAVLVPLIVWAWPTADRRRQVVLSLYIAWGLTDWFAGFAGSEMRVISLVLLVLVGLEFVSRQWPASPTEPLAAVGVELTSSPPTSTYQLRNLASARSGEPEQ